MRTPPATLTKTSAPPSGSPAWRASTATIIARRFGSTPVPTRRGIARSVGDDERLDLEQQRPRALERAGDRRADLARRRAAEDLGRIGHADEAGARHLEDAELVRRAEPVLHRAQDAMRVVAVALELQHAVDEVLEHARPGDRAVLRHVADEERGDAGLLRDAQQPRRRLAHLRDRARRRADLLRPERLHRVDHADGRPLALERRADRVELGLGEDLDVVAAAEPRRAQLHLRHRLLAGDEQRPPLARDRAERGQQERRLADAGLAADEHERRRDEPAAEHAVELGHAGRDPVGLLGDDVDEPERRAGPRRRRCGARARGSASATIVPNSPQPGQRPSQRPDVVPHSVHACWTAAAFAIAATVDAAADGSACRLWDDRPQDGRQAAGG